MGLDIGADVHVCMYVIHVCGCRNRLILMVKVPRVMTHPPHSILPQYVCMMLTN